MITEVVPDVTIYGGSVPDKSTMDRATFALAVHPYMNFFNTDSIPEIQAWRTSVNILTGQMNTLASEVSDKEALVSPHYDNIDIIGENIENINTIGSAMIDSTNPAVKLNSTANGYAKRVPKADRWLEIDTPNVIVDKKADDIRFSDGLYSRLGEELVTNGTFDIDTSGWTPLGSTLSVVGGKLQATDDGGGSANQTVTTVIGMHYILSVEAEVGTATAYQIVLGDGTTYNEYYDASSAITKTHTVAFTAISTTTAIGIAAVNPAGGTALFDNVSIKEVPHVELDDAPFASGTTDEAVASGTTATSGERAKIFVSGNTIYQAIIATANMDVTSDDWQVINDVTTLDIGANTKSGSVATRGVHTDITAYDDEIAIANKYSRLDNGLFVDGTTEQTLSMVYQRLNAGIYHVTHNPYGAATSTGGTPTSTYECFSISHTGGDIASASSTHPSGEYYDKIYVDNIIDVSMNTSSLDYDYIVRQFLSSFLDGSANLPYKSDQTLLIDYKAYSVEDSANYRYFPLNEKSGILKINEVNTNKNGATLVEATDGRLLLQIVNDTNSTDTIDLTSATNTVIYLPFYSKG